MSRTSLFPGGHGPAGRQHAVAAVAAAAARGRAVDEAATASAELRAAGGAAGTAGQVRGGQQGVGQRDGTGPRSRLGSDQHHGRAVDRRGHVAPQDLAGYRKTSATIDEILNRSAQPPTFDVNSKGRYIQGLRTVQGGG